MIFSPVQQSLFFSYVFYFDYSLIEDHFIHANNLNNESFVLIQFINSIYIFSIYLITRFILKIFKKRNGITIFNINETGIIYKLGLLYIILNLTLFFTYSLDSSFSKLLRILNSGLSSIPFLIGFYFFSLETSKKYLYLFFVIIFTLMNLSIGSRGLIFSLGFLFSAGFLLQEKHKKFRLSYTLIVTSIILLLSPIFSFIEVFRVQFGRLEYSEFSYSRIVLIFEEFIKISSIADVNFIGYARLITWPTLSVIILINTQVNQIGFSNIYNDINYLFTNTILSGKSVLEARSVYIDNLWGTSPANLFDYSVTETNSVEFSLLSDGLWRYGYYGFIFNVFIYLLIVLLIERFCIKKLVYNPRKIKYFLILALLYSLSLLEINAQPLFSILRKILYDTMTIILISPFLSYLFNKKKVF